MKIDELTIGDLVYSSFSDIPCKVQYLELRECGYGSVKTSNVDGIKDIASLYPIPLTPEIPEKNGFVEINDDSKWYKMQLLEENDFVGLEKLEDDYWMFGAVVFPNLINHLSIKYVHELQHALKLCRIDKELII